MASEKRLHNYMQVGENAYSISQISNEKCSKG